MSSLFLYRGVSESFHLASGGRLKPKTQGPFSYAFQYGESKWGSGLTYGSSAENAVIRHQLNQEGFPTSGISTTPHLHRAKFYTRGPAGTAGGLVFQIDRAALCRYGIIEFVVAKFCTPSIPEDDEIILVLPSLEHLPPEVIVDIITVPVPLS